MTKRPGSLAGAAFAFALTGWASTEKAQAQVAPAAPTALAVGDWQITPVAEVRMRGEYRHDLDDADQGTLVERARLGVDAANGPVEARVVVQDARGLPLGDGPSPVAGPAAVAYTGAYEAWVDAHTGPRAGTYLRVGRQAIQWGEGRLLGTSDWSATGRSLDAARARLTVGPGGEGAFELLGAVLVDPSTPDSLDSYGELLGARAEWTFDPLLGLELYALVRLANDDPALNLGKTVRGQTDTGALRVHGASSGWTYGVEGAYQIGHADDPDLERSAFAVAAHVSDQLENVLWRPVFALGGAYASGDRSDGRTLTGFDPMLPDVHVWHGAMDLVTWSNEVEVSASAGVTPWRDGRVGVEYRYLRLAEPSGAWTSDDLVTIGAATESTKGDLGHEVDASVSWSPWVPVELAAGYSVVALGDGARAVLAESGVGPFDEMTHSIRVSSLVQFAYAQVTATLP